MKKIILSILLLGSIFVMVGCSDQNNAKNFGGTYELNLEKGRKLVNITWKDSELWYLTKPMTEEDQAETYEFQEDSNYGIMEGKVIIKENK